jgi:hypothetical protein
MVYNSFFYEHKLNIFDFLIFILYEDTYQLHVSLMDNNEALDNQI